MAPSVALHLQPHEISSPTTVARRKPAKKQARRPKTQLDPSPPPERPAQAPPAQCAQMRADPPSVLSLKLQPPAPRAPSGPAPVFIDFVLFHLITLLSSVLRFVAAALRSLTRSVHYMPSLGMSPSRKAFPSHVAIAGNLRSPADARRVANLATAAGARRVTVFDPFGSDDKDRLIGPRHEKGRQVPEAEAGVVRYIRADAARALELVRAARVLASSPKDERPVNTRDPAELVGWLDNRLGPEPDVLLVFVDARTRLRYLGGFPVWLLRLAQVCFVDVNVKDFDESDMRDIAGRAAAMPKRFGR